MAKTKQMELDFFNTGEAPVKEEKPVVEEDFVVLDAQYVPMRCDEQVREAGWYSCYHELVLDLIPSLVPTHKTNKKGEKKEISEKVQRTIAKKIENKILNKCRNPTRLYITYKGKWSDEDLEILECHGVNINR